MKIIILILLCTCLRPLFWNTRRNLRKWGFSKWWFFSKICRRNNGLRKIWLLLLRRLMSIRVISLNDMSNMFLKTFLLEIDNKYKNLSSHYFVLTFYVRHVLFILFIIIVHILSYWVNSQRAQPSKFPLFTSKSAHLYTNTTYCPFIYFSNFWQ